MSAFEPQAWLEAFEAVGGFYVVTDNDRVNVGWSLEGRSCAEQLAAQRLFRDMQLNADHAALLKAHLLARQHVTA